MFRFVFTAFRVAWPKHIAVVFEMCAPVLQFLTTKFVSLGRGIGTDTGFVLDVEKGAKSFEREEHTTRARNFSTIFRMPRLNMSR